MSSFPVLTLPEFASLNSKFIGNKAHQLGQLFKLDLPIPETILIPSKTLKNILSKNGLDDKILEYLDKLDWDDENRIKAASKLIQNKIEKQNVPDQFAWEIHQIYDKYFHKSYLAVRTSPLNQSEENHQAHLNVKGATNLLDSILKLWAQQFSTELLQARYEEFKRGQFASLTILVQRMIESSSAGIAFTGKIPQLTQKLVIIYSCWGIADHIDQGRTIDKFYVQISSQNIVLRDLAIKLKQYQRKIDQTSIKKVPKAKQAESSLNDKEIIELSNYLIKFKRSTIENVSLEWAVEKGRVFIIGTKERPNKKNLPKIKPTFQQSNSPAVKINILTDAKRIGKKASDLINRTDKIRQEVLTNEKSQDKQVTIISNVRSLGEFLIIKHIFDELSIPFSKQNTYLIEIATPASLIEIEDFIEQGARSFSINLEKIHQLLKDVDLETEKELFAFDSGLIKKMLTPFFNKRKQSSEKIYIQLEIKHANREIIKFCLDNNCDSLLVDKKLLPFCYSLINHVTN